MAELEERAAEAEDLDVPDSSADTERAAGAKDLGMPDSSAAESAPNREPQVVTADSPEANSPQVTTGTPAEEPVRIEDPELAHAAAELDAHQAERQAEAEQRAAEDADRREERAVREASRAAAKAEAGTPEATNQSRRMGARPGHAVPRRPSGHHARACPSGRGRGRALTSERPLDGCLAVRARSGIRTHPRRQLGRACLS